MMKILYNIAIRCYRLLVSLASLWGRKARLLSQGERTAIENLRQNIHPDGGYIWIHASSLGEFEQGRPLIETIRRMQPDRRILLTFFSPSGYEVRKEYNGVDYVSYLPFDIPSAVKNFLDIVRPECAIFVKYEFWSNYLHELKRRKIPTYIISAIFRPEQMFFKPGGGFFRDMLRCFTHHYVQDVKSLQLLDSIGLDNVTACGDTRFDRVMDINRQARLLPLVEAFADNHFTWVAGSSWGKDEEIFIPYFNMQPSQRLIIAPHEIHEEHLCEIESRLKRPSIRLSKATEENIKQAHCLIIDSFGLLSSIYRYGSLAYIGGGFGAGIHNILEAAVYGIPVIFGPNYHKAREAHEMLDDKCAFTISGQQTFVAVMSQLLDEPGQLKIAGDAAGDYVRRNAGATQVIYNDIFDTSHQ